MVLQNKKASKREPSPRKYVIVRAKNKSLLILPNTRLIHRLISIFDGLLIEPGFSKKER